jgi:Zinc carboxypeptidase
MRRVVGLIAALGLSAYVVHAQQASRLADLKTKAEASDFKSTSNYDDVVSFMKAVAQASPKTVFYTTYGTTTEGRAMPLAIVGTGLKDGSAAAVKATGKLRVHVQANVHAGEVEGKESSLILLRELARGKHDDWLRSMVFLITPDYNADGNEKFSPTNRGTQNGPVNGEGTRANAQGLNINRDYMKLDTPEAQAFVKLWNDYDPQVGFDLHTSDGSYHGYYLTYSPPLNPDTDPSIVRLMTDEWFPFVTKQIKAKHGWDTFYYGNAAAPGRGGFGGEGRGREGAAAAAGPPAGIALQRGRGGPACVNNPPPEGVTREWRTFEDVPRFHNNYVGFRNRFGLLSEAYAYATFEDRIKATSYFLEAALDFASQNAAKLKSAVAAADKQGIVGQRLATTARMKRDGMVDILMGEVEPVRNPVSDRDMCNRKDVTRHEQMVDMMWFEPETSETVPSAYYVPAEATKAIELLKAHGIVVRPPARQPVAGIEQFVISSDNATQKFEGHTLRKLGGTWEPVRDATVARGALEVPMDQPLARLAFYLLEPASDDGLVAWNFLDDRLNDAKTYPILRKK